jgi:predicted SAM-dependent methyltransferase
MSGAAPEAPRGANRSLMDWEWENPATLSSTMQDLLVTMARCAKLEPVLTSARFTRAELGALGITGVEFAAWKTQHPTGLGSDVVALRAEDGAATEPGYVFAVDGRYHFAQLDICRPLPFEDGCVDWVYAEHLVEHVSPADGIGWLAEVRRILAPGGLLRLTTPDLRRYAESYLSGGAMFARHRRRMSLAGVGPPMPARDAFMVNQMFYLWGHRWIYDFEELRYALAQAGFPPDAVRCRAYRQGDRPDVAALDQVLRNDETLYVEVTKEVTGGG